MAERWAVANGNATTTATWNGGTLPAVGDDVYTNGFAVTVNVSRQWLSARNTAGTTAVAGGFFTLSNGVTLTANIFSGAANCVQFFGASPNIATIIGNVTAGTFRAVFNSSTGTLNIQGNCTGGISGAANGVVNNSTGIVNITGNCIGGSGGTGDGAQNASTGTLNITGDCIGGATGNNRGVTVSDGTVTVHGNCIGGVAGAGLRVVGATAIVNVIGDCIGSETSGAFGLITTAGCSAVITGNCYGGLVGNSAGVSHGGSSLVINGDCIGRGDNTTTNNRGVATVSTATGTVTVNGDCIGGAGTGFRNGIGATAAVTVNGDAIGGSGPTHNSAAGIWDQSSGSVVVKGLAIGSSTGAAIAPGVHCVNTLGVPVVIDGSKFGPQGASPVSGLVVRSTLVDATLEVRDAFLNAILLS